jgi:chromosomal replication initiation ATPase DnaA
MNLNTAIYNGILEPKYLKLYHLIEALGNTKVERFKQDYKKDIVQIISDIIVIKDKYKISYNEDLILIEKYKS